MGLILLVRHGQASWGAADYDVLSDLGHEQARLLGRTLAARGVVPQRVVCGAMRRHRETAEGAIAAAGWAADLETDEDWNEFDHLRMLEVHGPPDGAAGEEMTRQEFDAWFDSATRRWISGEQDEDYDEPFSAFTARVESALRRTTEASGSGEVAVVFSSGGPVSWAAASLLGGGADMWRRLNPVTVNGSVTKVVVGSRGATLVSLNDHSHLEPDHVTYR